MPRIKFNLDRSRNTHKYIMCIYYIRQGVRYKVSTGQKILPHQWDPKKQRCHKGEESEQINEILDKIEKIIREQEEYYNSHGVTPGWSILKEKVKEVVKPQPDLPEIHITPQSFSRHNYFKRFYDLLSEVGSMKDAYYQVEMEWNDQGVSMFENYSAFKVGKNRYLKGLKTGYKIKSI